MKTNNISYIACIDKHQADLNSLYPKRRDLIFQSTKLVEIEVWIDRPTEKIILLDKKLVGKKFPLLFQKALQSEGPTYTVVFDALPKDFKKLAPPRMANVEIFPQAPNESSIRFFVEKGIDERLQVKFWCQHPEVRLQSVMPDFILNPWIKKKKDGTD